MSYNTWQNATIPKVRSLACPSFLSVKDRTTSEVKQLFVFGFVSANAVVHNKSRPGIVWKRKWYYVHSLFNSSVVSTCLHVCSENKNVSELRAVVHTQTQKQPCLWHLYRNVMTLCNSNLSINQASIHRPKEYSLIFKGVNNLLILNKENKYCNNGIQQCSVFS